jgi:hypothetical protein
MCGAIRMTLKCERSEHYINERWCYEQTDRRSAMIYHRICEAYICEVVKKDGKLLLIKKRIEGKPMMNIPLK